MAAEATVPPRDAFAAKLRGFGPAGIAAIVAILAGNILFVPLSAILVLVWARRSHTPWRDLGFVRPKSWPATIAIGVIFGVAFKFLMKMIVMPLLGAPPINQAYHFLAGNRAALPWMLYLILIGAGFGEETVFRGWMFERFGALFGRSAVAKAATILITSAWFGVAHYSVQGLPGTEQAAIVGLVFGTIFTLRRQLPLLMIAHAAFDLAALAMIYWDVETSFAHLVFR